jgi:hypothetical protein
MALALTLLLALVATVVAVGGRAFVHDPIVFRKNGILNSHSDVRQFNDMAGLYLPATYCQTSSDAPCATYHSPKGDLYCDYAVTAHGTKICRQTVSSKTGLCYCGVFDEAVERKRKSRNDDNDEGDDGDDDDDDDDGGGGDAQGIDEPNYNGSTPYNYTRWLPKPPPGGWGAGWGGSGQPVGPIRVPESSTPCKTSCDNACAYSSQYCCESSASGTCDLTLIDGVCYCGEEV